MAGKGIVIQITGDGDNARAVLEMVREQMHETAEVTKEEASSIIEANEAVKESFEALSAVYGLEALIDVMKEVVGSSLEYGEAMAKAAARTGLTVESLSVLHYAAGVMGGDFEGMTAGLTKLNVNIAKAADGNVKAAKTFSALGLDAKELAGRTDGAEIAFHKIVQTIAATESPTRRTQLAVDTLGKSAGAQIPMLIEVARNWDEFKEKAQAAGVLLTGETAAGLEETNRKLGEMKEQLQGAGVQITQGMMPDLSALGRSFTSTGNDAEGFREIGASLGLGVKVLASLFDLLTVAVRQTADVLIGFGNGSVDVVKIIADLMTGDFSGAKNAAEAWKNDWHGAFQVAGEDGQHFKDQMKALWGYQPEGKPKALEGGAGGGGFEGGGGKKSGKERSDNAIATAAAALLSEQAKAEADARKFADQAQLAELEAQHRMLLISDQEFYTEKLRLQNDALRVEQDALEAKGRDLAALEARQKKDPLLKRNAGGQSAEELKTAREQVQVQEQIAAVQARRLELESAYNAEVDASNKATGLDTLRLAAELEKERNTGLTAQLALIREETRLRAEKVRNAGGSAADAANVESLGRVAEAKLRIDDLTRQITESEGRNRLAVEAVNDAAQKDPRLKRQAEGEVNRLNAQEAAELRALTAEYDALAQELGGEFVEKARALHAEVDKLARPDNREAAQFAKELAAGFESMANRIVDSSIRGRESFHQMAKDIERDLLELTLKMAEKQFLTPLLEGGLGSLANLGRGGGGGLGTASALPQLLGPAVQAATGGGGGIWGKLADAGAGKQGAMDVVVKIENQSATPLAATQTTGSLTDLKQFVLHTVLQEAGSGGGFAAALGIGG